MDENFGGKSYSKYGTKFNGWNGSKIGTQLVNQVIHQEKDISHSLCYSIAIKHT